MRIAVLGPTSCISETGEHFVPAPLDRRLLAALAVDRHRVWSVDELADAVWGEPAGEATKLVRNRVSALRARLGRGFVDSIAKGYRLGSTVRLDADDLMPGRPIEAITGQRLAAAWRGEPFQDLEDWPPARAAATRARIGYANLVEGHVAADLARNEADRAVVGAHTLVAFDPYRERGWELLAQALFATGRQREALDACHRARAMLGEVGLEAGPLLIETERGIAARESSVLGASVPSFPSPDSVPLIRQGRLQSSFIGRVDDLLRLNDLLDRHRLVTVVGLGGVGKTRLAVELAHQLGRRDGSVPMADLVTAATDDDVAAVVARAIGLPSAAEQIGAIRAWATGARGLLILDNAEHVLRGTAEVAAAVIECGARIDVLVTSRSPLGLPGEVVVALAPLTDTDAVDLFTSRSPRAHGRVSVEQLCAAVGRVPLAIELAAGRTDAVAPGELARRLSDDPTALDRAGAERHSSVSAIVDWSVGSLDPTTEAVLADLAVFVAPFTLDACLSVIGGNGGSDRTSGVDALTKLVRSSLVQVEFGEPTRYRLLELVRRSAASSLARSGRRDAVEQRLASWAATVVDATRMGDGAALVDDIPNLEAGVLIACATGDPATALRIGRAQMPLSLIGRSEARRWAAAAIVVRGADSEPLFPRVAGDASFLLALSGQIDEARSLAGRIVDVAAGTSGDGWARHGLAIIGADDAADEHALSIARARGDKFLELAARSTLAQRGARTHPEAAWEHGEASARLAREIGLPWADQLAAYTCGVALTQSDPATAEHHLRRAQAIADRAGIQITSAITRVLLLGCPDSSRSQLARDRDALEQVLTNGIDQMAAVVLARLPADLAADGHPQIGAAVAAFFGHDDSLLRLHDVRNMVRCDVSEHVSDPSPLAAITSVLDVLRLLDEFR